MVAVYSFGFGRKRGKPRGIRPEVIKKQPSNKITKNTLVIHIRCGDIFDPENEEVHPAFYQPPLSYYQHIIKNNDYSDILIIADPSRNNPVINSLMRSNKKIRISDGDLIEDINLILNATLLVLSRSSFGLQIARISKKLKYLYGWKDNSHWKGKEMEITPEKCLSNDIVVTRYLAIDYIKIGDWKCTEEQIELMLNYPINKLTFKVERNES